ncbi:MAG: MFS transporter [Chloroflexi bacterium]|nr:MAG: MFS transporter [Chloroflexota bacterium]
MATPEPRVATPTEAVPDSPIPGISRPVFVLSLVSFLTDISSEMIYPLVPLFLTSVLGAPLAAVGLIEGVAESTASVLKTVSGWLSDRLGMRKPLVVAGYALSGLAKPLMAAAYVWPAALGVRFLDRAGKGIRTAPRDAIIADATPERHRGRAFGFHRGMDTAGAVIGPAIGLGLLALLDQDFRLVFLIAGLPALGGVALLWVLPERRPIAASADIPARVPLRELGRPFFVFLAVMLVFAVGNSSDAFLILRSKDLGLSNTATVGAYVLYNTIYALGSAPAGVASDRLGARPVITAGLGVFALVYLGFGLASGGALVWPLFAVYGVYMALTDGVAKALISNVVPARERATAIGIYTGATGAMILLSSVLAGALWDLIDPSAPFLLGGVTALAALVLLVALLPRDAGVRRNGI